jgi:hypothetical protein
VTEGKCAKIKRADIRSIGSEMQKRKPKFSLTLIRDPIALRKKRQSGKSYLPNQAAHSVTCALSATIPFTASMTDEVFAEAATDDAMHLYHGF